MQKVKFVQDYVSEIGNTGAHFRIPEGTIGIADYEDEDDESVWIEKFEPPIFKTNRDLLKHCRVPLNYVKEIKAALS